MKLCVLGNSHIACLKFAWQRLQTDYPGVHLTFFGAHHLNFYSTQYVDGCILPTSENVLSSFELTSGGQSTIRLGDYDLFWIHGLSLDLLGFYNHYFLQRCFYSNQVLSMNFRNILDYYPGLHVLEMLVPNTTRSIFFSHKPFRTGPVYERETDAAEYELLVQRFREDLRQIGASFIEQPVESMSMRGCTKEEFAKNSMRLAMTAGEQAFHEEGEINHMNDQFGILLLKKLFQQCL